MEIPNHRKEKKYSRIKRGQRRSCFDELLAECQSVLENGVVLEMNDCSCILYEFSKCGLTQRAVDAGDSARFEAVSHASAFFHLDGVPPSAPAPLTQAVGRLVEMRGTVNEIQHFL